MPYGLHYAYEFKTRAGDTERVEFLLASYAGPVQVMKAKKGVTPIEQEDGVSDPRRDEAIQGTSLKLTLQSLSGFGIETFLAEKPKQWQIRRYLNGNLLFAGHLVEDLPLERLIENKPFTIEATCGLSDLDSELFTGRDGRGIETLITIREALTLSLSKTGLDLELWVATETYTAQMNVARCALEQAYFNPLQFVSDGDKPDSCRAVLEEIAKTFGLLIRQREGHWEVIEPGLETGAVKFFRFDALGKYLGTIAVDRTGQIEGAHERPDVETYDKELFVFDGQETTFRRSVKEVSRKLDYGKPKNRLRNYRFSELAAARRDGVRMPAHWGTTPTTKWSLQKPDLGTGEDYFSTRYLRLAGRRPADKMPKSGLLSYAVGASASDAFENCFFQILAVPNVHNVKLSGRFRQFDARGAKLAVFACPFRSLAAYSKFKNNPALVPAARDLNLAYTYILQNGGGWGDGDAVHLFDNTETRLSNGIETEFAAPDWKSFDVSFKLGPFWNFGGLAGRSDQKLKNGGIPLFAKAGQGTLVDIQVPVPGYLLMVALGEATDFDEGNEFPAQPGPAASAWVEYDGLKLSYAPTGDQDTKGEKFVISAPDGSGGEVRSEVSVKLGDCRNPNYYATLYEPDRVTPTREWFRVSDPGFTAPLLHHVCSAELSRDRAPRQTVSGDALSARMQTGNAYRLTWPKFTGKRFLCLGTVTNARTNEHRAVLVQVPVCPNAAHTGRHYDVLPDRLSLVATREGGECYASDKGIRFTKVSQNGQSGTTSGLFVFPLYAVRFEWADGYARPPYKLTLRQIGDVNPATQLGGAIGGLFYETTLIPGEYEATVTNAQGKQAQHKFKITHTPAKVGTLTLLGGLLKIPLSVLSALTPYRVTVKSKTGRQLTEETIALPPGETGTELSIALPDDFGTDDVIVEIESAEGVSRARQSVVVPEPPRVRRYDPARYADKYE